MLLMQMKVFETNFNDMKFESSFSQPTQIAVPTVYGPMTFYPRAISGNSFTTIAFKLLKQGWYNLYIELLKHPAGGRFQCFTTNNVLKSTVNTYEEFNVPVVQYLGTIFSTEYKKERLIFKLVSKDTYSTGDVLIAGKIYVEFNENAFK